MVNPKIESLMFTQNTDCILHFKPNPTVKLSSISLKVAQTGRTPAVENIDCPKEGHGKVFVFIVGKT